MIACIDIRDTVLGALGDPIAGLNARLAPLCGTYAIAPMSFDFTGPDSQDVTQCYYGGEADLVKSPLTQYPALAVYTSVATNARTEKGRQFSGVVTLHLDFYLMFRFRFDDFSGIEGNDTETTKDVLVEAVLRSLPATLPWPTGVAFNGIDIIEPSPVQPLSDGWQQRVPIQINFGVNV